MNPPDEQIPIHPAIYVHLSTDDARSMETGTVLLTIQTRVPLAVMEATDFVGDLFKEMFEERKSGP